MNTRTHSHRAILNGEHHLVVDLRISAEEYRKLYAGAASSVRAFARDGRSVRFPASMLRNFVTSSGIAGSFMFELDGDNKLQRLVRI